VPLTSNALHLLAVTSGGSSGGGGGGGLLGFLPLILILGVGYLLLIRPARNRQRKALETRNQVEPGSEVTTTAGLIATVIAVDDDTVTLEIAPGVHSRFLKGAIARVNTPVDADDDEPDAAETTPDTTQPGSISLDKTEPTEH
jgi:preprotein translocase subunit YajC